eukprot:6058497-Amphidinium_carterae.1
MQLTSGYSLSYQTDLLHMRLLYSFCSESFTRVEKLFNQGVTKAQAGTPLARVHLCPPPLRPVDLFQTKNKPKEMRSVQ